MWLRINLSLCKTQSITDFRSCGRNMGLGLHAHSLSLVEKTKKKKKKLFFSPTTKHFKICSDWNDLDYMSICETSSVFV